MLRWYGDPDAKPRLEGPAVGPRTLGRGVLHKAVHCTATTVDGLREAVRQRESIRGSRQRGNRSAGDAKDCGHCIGRAGCVLTTPDLDGEADDHIHVPDKQAVTVRSHGRGGPHRGQSQRRRHDEAWPWLRGNRGHDDVAISSDGSERNDIDQTPARDPGNMTVDSPASVNSCGGDR